MGHGIFSPALLAPGESEVIVRQLWGPIHWTNPGMMSFAQIYSLHQIPTHYEIPPLLL